MLLQLDDRWESDSMRIARDELIKVNSAYTSAEQINERLLTMKDSTGLVVGRKPLWVGQPVSRLPLLLSDSLA
jgi:hypothetical protein